MTAAEPGRLRELLASGETVPLRIVGGSMAPFLRPGDVVDLVALAPGEVPRPGALVARDGGASGLVVVHRVIACPDDRVLTRGDAAPAADGAVAAAVLLGRAVGARRGGRRLRLGLDRGGRLVAWLSRHDLLAPLLAPPRRLARLLRR